MQLSGSQMQALCEALGSAFTTDTLRMMLRFRLSRDLDDYAAPASKRVMIFNLVDASQREGWTTALLSAAREANPGNAPLVALGGEVGLASIPTIGTERSNLERIVRDETPYNDLGPWLEQWGKLETQVCQVEVYQSGAVGYGTGFLVGPDLVLTNHHVVAKVISDEVGPDRVLCRFDYKRQSDGMTLNHGSEYRLAEGTGWLLDSSPPSPEDEKVDGTLPSPDLLDYALLRLEEKAGDLPVGANPEPGARKRSWIKAATETVQANDILFLLQHPDREPLKQASGRVLQVNANQTRIKHDVNTEGGSSGSPCFAADLSLVALHHSGDPNFNRLYHPEYNQAVPMDKIVARLESKQIDLPA